MFIKPTVNSAIITEDSLRGLLYKNTTNGEVRNYTINKMFREYSSLSELLFTSLIGLYTPNLVKDARFSPGIVLLDQQHERASMSDSTIITASEVYTPNLPFEELMKNFEQLITALGVLDYNDTTPQTIGLLSSFVYMSGVALRLPNIANGVTFDGQVEPVVEDGSKHYRKVFHFVLGIGFLHMTVVTDDVLVPSNIGRS